MLIFFKYILLGISLAAPIGPVNAAQMDRGIKHGFFNSWLIGLGATCADGLYMLLVYLGLVQYINTPFIKSFLWLFGSFLLLYTGIESLKIKQSDIKNQTSYTEKGGRSFTAGFFMSLTNPLTILFWIGIYGSILADTASRYSMEKLLLYSGAIFIGILLWDFTMAVVSSSFRKFLADRFLVVISRISGLCLIAFGIYFGYEAYLFIF